MGHSEDYSEKESSCEEIVEKRESRSTVWLWVWYFVILIIAWIIIYFVGRHVINGATAFFFASLFALMVGMIILPYFKHPKMSSGDKASITVFIILAILLPFVGLIAWGVVLSGKKAMSSSKVKEPRSVEKVFVEDTRNGEKVVLATTEDFGRTKRTTIFNPPVAARPMMD